jgi:hypothetical protein
MRKRGKISMQESRVKISDCKIGNSEDRNGGLIRQDGNVVDAVDAEHTRERRSPGGAPGPASAAAALVG